MCIFEFKKEVINIYEESHERADAGFQSVYSKAVSLSNKLITEEK